MKNVSWVAAWALAMGPLACGGDNSSLPPPEQTGQACTSVTQCYPGTDAATFMGGPAVCLDKVSGGYCTHLCSRDSDCCAVPGECRTGFPQVCSPFESTTDKYCILSCENVVLGDAGFTDANAYCATY